MSQVSNASGLTQTPLRESRMALKLVMVHNGQEEGVKSDRRYQVQEQEAS